jgi:hypothetical protein
MARRNGPERNILREGYPRQVIHGLRTRGATGRGQPSDSLAPRHHVELQRRLRGRVARASPAAALLRDVDELVRVSHPDCRGAFWNVEGRYPVGARQRRPWRVAQIDMPAHRVVQVAEGFGLRRINRP